MVDATEYYGRMIINAEINDYRFRLTFADGVNIEIRDDAQSCCESRRMTTDDDITSLCGHTLVRIEAKEGPTLEGEWDEEHEQVFVEVGTDKGFITIVNHNEHNGYYGGFELTVTKVEEPV